MKWPWVTRSLLESTLAELDRARTEAKEMVETVRSEGRLALQRSEAEWQIAEERLLGEIERARRDKQIAEDRLYAAWKEGGIAVPTREAVIPQSAKPIELLPDKLRDYVNNWESPDVRAELEGEIRRLHFELSWPEERVLQLLRDRTPEMVV